MNKKNRLEITKASDIDNIKNEDIFNANITQIRKLKNDLKKYVEDKRIYDQIISIINYIRINK